MKLHEAIIDVLRSEPQGLTAREIAERINQKKTYSRGDNKPLPASQISARVNNYQHLLTKNGSIITLNKESGRIPLPNQQKANKAAIAEAVIDTSLLQKMLMNEKNFKAAADIDTKVPTVPGLYCIRIRDIGQLINSFRKILEDRGHNILYIGVASQSLEKRLLGQELRARGHGTFFRSIGAVLGFRPEKGSLIGRKNQNNYTFTPQDEVKIIAWINEHLLVNWVRYNENSKLLEAQLLETYLPLLNIAGNPGALSELRQLRNACKQIAREM